jgi:hypothetical protein
MKGAGVGSAVTRRVTRDGRRHGHMTSLSIHAHMIEDDDERDLVIVDGVIAAAEPIPGIGPDASGWVLPGLVDVHSHLSVASPAGDDQDADVRVRASASVELALGVLAIREPGSPDDASTRLGDEDGWPRVITAGRFRDLCLRCGQLLMWCASSAARRSASLTWPESIGSDAATYPSGRMR